VKIDARDFFQKYLDPHKPEVAEWGAQVGFWGGNRPAALERVSNLAETAITQAGLGASKRLEYCKQRFAEIEALRSSVRSRVFLAFARLTGVTSFSSTRWLRRILEGGLDLAVIVFLPLVLIALWPSAAIARWRFHRADDRESGALGLKAAAKIYLMVWFETHADRGELAAKIKNRRADDPRRA
jgi:hypothetical protein